MNCPTGRGFSFITFGSAGNEAKAKAAKVSMMIFTHNIWVTVNGRVVPMNAPISTTSKAVKLIVNWNMTKRWIFLYNDRPHMTAVTMLRNESSSNVMSLASLATEVPDPIDRPTWAKFNAGASFVPSPVTATTSPSVCNNFTNRCLSNGRARLITFKSLIRCRASSSLNAAKSTPRMQFFFSSSPSFHKPI